MKRYIFIFAMLLCVFPSHAISKKKVLAQRDELVNKILQEYQFTSNFDSISVALQNAYYAKAKELIEKTYATYYGNGYYLNGKQVSTDEFRLHEIRNVGVNFIKLNDNLSLSKDVTYMPKLFWYFEGPNLLNKYPEIRELDKLLSKKKCYYYMLEHNSNHHDIVSKWMKNIKFDWNIDAAIEKHKREKIEREERLQKEREAKQRELQRQRDQIPKERTFIAVKYCELNNAKWSEWSNTNKKVVIKKDYRFGRDYIVINYGEKEYFAEPKGIDYWYCYLHADNKSPNCEAELKESKNGYYKLYLRYTSGAICYYLKLDDSNSPAARAKKSINEWLLGRWTNGSSYIDISKYSIRMNLHQYEAVYDYIKDIEYDIEGNQIITNLNNGTITIDRSNNCLYFRGVKYTFKPL